MENRISHVVSTLSNYFLYVIFKLVAKKPIKVYYWNEEVNFGDLITRDLLKHYRYRPIWFNQKRADLISTGSLIEHLSEDFKGTILGTGAIDINTKTKFLYANIVGLRGEKTKKNLSVSSQVVLGDPGLLSDRLIQNNRAVKKFELGVIAHYSDANSVVIQKLKSKFGAEILFINVRQEPLLVLREMDACKHIISSSLHGLICADSLGISNRWIKLSNLLGGNFKFEDYYSVFGVNPVPYLLTGEESLNELVSKTASINQEKIVEVKMKLEKLFVNLKV
jgi:hypothetical protein